MPAVIDQHKAALERQTTDPDQKRDGGTQPRDWEYQLADGVRTRQVTFYVDGGVPLYGKLFLPQGFTTAGKYSAVVVGHGINALSIGIEKFASRFAERGLVAMAIDYQSDGFSGSGSDDIRLLEPDPTTDAAAVTELERRILLKRTNLNNVHEIADFRAAVSFLQGEPGVDPDRIGIWGSSNGGAIVMAVAALDARVKAVVSQVSAPRPAPRGPVAVVANLLPDAITRVRTGQGSEVDGGFSFKSKIDAWSNQRNRDVRPGTTLDQIRPTTAVLLIPAEKDELTGGAAAGKDVRFFSEAVSVHGRLFYPPGFAPTGASPAVVLAPGWGETAAAVERQAEQFAASGIVALAIDYRGWGQSGGFNYLADGTRWDDRLRFSQHASTVRIRRKRLLPETQLIDIRNAITFLQGEPGVDPARIGVWGTGVSGAHVVALAATDARVKAGVAVTPGTVGQGSDRLSFSPTVPQRTDLVRLARSGQVPATQVLARAMNTDETRLALAEYRPLALLDQIPKTSAVLQITDQQGDAALEAAVQWFLKQLWDVPPPR